MHAFVFARMSGAEVAGISLSVKQQFAETFPRLPVVVGDSHVQGIAIGEHIVPNAVGCRQFGQWSGVASEKQHSAVGKSI